MVFLSQEQTVLDVETQEFLKKENRNATAPTPVKFKKRKLRNDGRGEGAGNGRHRHGQQRRRPPTDPQTHVSSVVSPPTTGDRSSRSSGALETRTRPLSVDRFEVVVVWTTAPPCTAEWCARRQPVFPCCGLDRAGPWRCRAGRNRGVDEARGDVIVFIDSDLVVTPASLPPMPQPLGATGARAEQTVRSPTGGINTQLNFADPSSEPPQAPADHSCLFSPPANVAIDATCGALRPV